MALTSTAGRAVTGEVSPSRQRGHAGLAPVDHEIVVVGAGFSGIGLGIHLKRASFHDFAILDAADGVGGVWRHNVYPGVAVDIPSTTYSYSFEQNPRWSRLFAPGAELREYAEHCTEKYGLAEHLRLRTKVHSAEFDEAENIWRIDTGGEVITTRFLVGAVGPLDAVKYPEIPGIDDFAGDIMHTARWDNSVRIDGARVAIIGTGASSLQVTPEIAPRAAHLDVYQRTPIWVIPKPNTAIPSAARQLFRFVPPAQYALRAGTSTIAEFIMTAGAVYHTRVPFLVRYIERVCLQHLANQVEDSETRAKLTPDYAFGCKRPSFSSTYLPTFNRPNVDLVTDSIARLATDGIVTVAPHPETGAPIETFRPVDTLILATGFKTLDQGGIPAFPVIGVDGVELGRHWYENRYRNYEGISTPVAPNFWLMNGAWSVAGSSWFSVIESGCTHIVRCLTEARRRSARRVVVRDAAMDRYMTDMHKSVRHTVFAQPSCANANSYYFDHHGDAPFVRPVSGPALWLASRTFDLDDYEYDPTPIGLYDVPLH